ncbi:MAG: iron chelate uptake ABC transporter family permease subunit [Planctomycetota bacterium]
MRRRLPPVPLAALLLVLLAVLLFLSLRSGPLGTLGAMDVLRGVLAVAGLGEPLEPGLQGPVRLRLFDALTAAGVGAALALSGGLLQGLFRNGLASPSMIGVTAGAALGAAVAIVLIGGYGPGLFVEQGAGFAPVVVTVAGFGGALGVGFLVLALGSSGGRVSVPTLLLVGIAVNTCVAGAIAAIQSLTLGDDHIVRAIMSWTFGTLDDRSPYHALLVWSGVSVAFLMLPFVAVELDLFAGGEHDAEALGVRVGRVKLLTLLGASLAAASAVAVAGQIAFVGLIVPHLVRLLAGPAHRALLPLSLLGGAAFLMAADLLQGLLFAGTNLQPGVLMSLVGGPFFLALLLRNRRAVTGW